MRLLQMLLGCRHRKTSFPLTETRFTADGQKVRLTYVACLDCGREMTYSWEEMRMVA